MAINTITASGNLGKDCEQRWTPNGKAVASFSLPVKQGYGEHEKGTKVTVTGEFVMEEWTSQSGEKKSAPVIIVNQLDFGGNGGNQAGSQKPQQNQGWGQPQQPQKPAPQSEPPMDFDDDIPF
ncbi:TPA: single-stranded DNA-binding protein [Proteus mirabilis]|nr:single-stranded DNA-binding protein [Proteus mirabilis]